MNNLSKYIETWVVKRTQERHYLCRLCAGPNDDHGIEESFQRHLSSWGHKIRIKKMEELFCKVCSIQFKYPSHFKAHLQSKSHCNKADPSTKPNMTCESCNVHFRSFKEQERHNATQKHAKNTSKHMM